MQPPSEPNRRNWMIACGAVGAGAAAAVAVPFSGFHGSLPRRLVLLGLRLRSTLPTFPRAVSKLLNGVASLYGSCVAHPEMVQGLEALNSQLADPNSDRTDYPVPAYAKNIHRSIKPEVLVTVGICTHLGCSPVSKFETGEASGLASDWPGGFFLPLPWLNLRHCGACVCE
jgi:ubiquinol-cytochrome c reductase iron-sulfur subunit